LEVRDSAENTIYMLEEQTMPDSDEPLYNEREISHMIDVKHLTDQIRRGGWILAIVAVAGITLLLYRNETEQTAYRAIRNGGYATIAILIGIGAFLLLAWDVFFVKFHELLFPDGTWTFYYTDSLIRLFPEKLWFDVGTFIVGGTLAAGIVCLLVGQWLLNRTKR
jgi:integral membrane protein (TIGR01906 family)